MIFQGGGGGGEAQTPYPLSGSALVYLHSLLAGHLPEFYQEKKLYKETQVECVVENSVDPDRMASDLHCFQSRI